MDGWIPWIQTEESHVKFLHIKHFSLIVFALSLGIRVDLRLRKREESTQSSDTKCLSGSPLVDRTVDPGYIRHVVRRHPSETHVSVRTKKEAKDQFTLPPFTPPFPLQQPLSHPEAGHGSNFAVTL